MKEVSLDLINQNLNKLKFNNNIKKNLNFTLFRKKEKFFIKILCFQILVSGFVFFTLFFIKLTLPNKFNNIINQLKIAIEIGPLFNNKLNEAVNCTTNCNSNLNCENSLSKNDVSNVPAENLDIVMVDNLDQNSVDDGDLCYFNFIEPISGGVNKISSGFGARINPLNNKNSDFHNGVDIVAKTGTPVVSIADGVVVRADFSKKSGNFLILNHDNGYESRYAHCSKLLKKLGDFVKKGEQIALSGQTGNVTGPHLHFGLRQNNNWIDPKKIYPNMK